MGVVCYDQMAYEAVSSGLIKSFIVTLDSSQ